MVISLVGLKIINQLKNILEETHGLPLLQIENLDLGFNDYITIFFHGLPCSRILYDGFY